MIATETNSDDAFDDVDFYALPDWWDSDEWELVPTGMKV